MSADELNLEPTDPVDPLTALRQGDITVEGRMPWSSNGTFLVSIHHEGHTVKAVYKPERGERPLWDFPAGLYRREIAAWHLSEALGFGVVPPTIERDGPFGPGSVQLFVAADFEQHYFTLHENRPDLFDRLRAVGVFDVIANNADRKSGHVLLGLDGEIHAIDQGLCFAVEYKLRTVIWDFVGEPVPDELLPAVERIATAPPEALTTLLGPDEVGAVAARAARLVRKPVFPDDPTGRRWPWPLV